VADDGGGANALGLATRYLMRQFMDLPKQSIAFALVHTDLDRSG